MAKRRSNPSWLTTTLIAVATFVVGAGVAVAAGKRGKVPGLSGKPSYNYWAYESPGLIGTEWIPVIRESGFNGSTYELMPELTQQAALWAAKQEILDRGGEPHEGKPTSMNPRHRRPRSLRVVK